MQGYKTKKKLSIQCWFGGCESGCGLQIPHIILLHMKIPRSTHVMPCEWMCGLPLYKQMVSSVFPVSNFLLVFENGDLLDTDVVYWSCTLPATQTWFPWLTFLRCYLKYLYTYNLTSCTSNNNITSREVDRLISISSLVDFLSWDVITKK